MQPYLEALVHKARTTHQITQQLRQRIAKTDRNRAALPTSYSNHLEHLAHQHRPHHWNDLTQVPRVVLRKHRCLKIHHRCDVSCESLLQPPHLNTCISITCINISCLQQFINTIPAYHFTHAVVCS